MTPTKIYITTVGENEITVSINGEAAVTKTVKPTLTALGNSKIRFQCDDIDETVLTYLYIIVNGQPLKGSWIGEEDYLSVALFEAIMNKTFTSSGSPGGSSSYLSYVALVSKFGSGDYTSGELIIGETYEITDFNAGDDFSNVADVISGTINTTGCVFKATGTTPTNWTHSSELESLGESFYSSINEDDEFAPSTNTLIGNTTLGGGGIIGTIDIVNDAEIFLAGKTYPKISNNYNGGGDTFKYYAYRVDDNTIRVKLYDADGNPADINAVPVEINVYP